MAHLWIIHRDPRWRAFLSEMAGAVQVLAGDPADAVRFEAAAPPRAVLLGVAGDFEPELEFVHRFESRLVGTDWVLLVRPLDEGEVARLFDALPATLVPIASDAVVLRARLRAALARRHAAALTSRVRRDSIAARFARWHGDLEDPALLASVDPARSDEALVVRGEPGTGRGLVARYAHAFGARDADSPFAAIACQPDLDLPACLAALVPETGELPTRGTLTLCLEDVDTLPVAVQRALRDAIENAGAARRLRAARVRWMATAGDPRVLDRLDPGLARALAGLQVRLPPLRERLAAIDALVRATGRGFAEDALARLRAHPWPGNHRELEAVLRRTLAATRRDPIEARDLRFETASLGDLLGPGAELPRAEERSTAPAEGVAGLPGGAEAAPSGRAAAPPSAAGPPGAVEVAAAAPLGRITAAVAHEIGNPLVGIRTYAAMLPSRFDDPEFRRQFAERVESDTRRIADVLDTLARLGTLPAPARERVDLSALLARLLERERPRIRERRLVVLEELDRQRPEALGDAEQLRFALGVLVEQVLDWVPERGDLYVGTRHRPGADARPAALAVLVRFSAPADSAGFGENALAVAVVDAVVRSHGGSLRVDGAVTGETTIVIELPAA